MAHCKIMMRVLLSSPSDTQEEREIVMKVVDDINVMNKNTLFGIELVMWEKDVPPRIIMKDGQSDIDRTFDYQHADMLIGIFNKIAGEGTQHEISEAIGNYVSYNFPEIKLYFREENKKFPKKINDLKKYFFKKGICCVYNSLDIFQDNLRRHIQVYFDNFTKKFSRSSVINLHLPEIANLKINSYRLFYYRTKMRGMTIRDLSKKSQLSQAKIKKYEKVIIDDISNVTFPDCTYADMCKLEEALEINHCNLEMQKNDERAIEEYQYYKRSKGLVKMNFEPSIKYKAVIFDFDGTIANPKSEKNTWQKIWTLLGYTLDICQSLHALYDRKEIGHQEWCDKTAEYFKQRHMKKSDLASIISDTHLIEGTSEVLTSLHNAGIKLFIVSGSIKEVIVGALGEQVSLFDEIVANDLIFDKDNFLEKIDGTDYDFEGKAKYITQLSDRIGIQTKDMLFIGNSFNDAHVYKSGAKTLCVNPTLTNSHNTRYWHNSIDSMKNLKEILPFCIAP